MFSEKEEEITYTEEDKTNTILHYSNIRYRIMSLAWMETYGVSVGLRELPVDIHRSYGLLDGKRLSLVFRALVGIGLLPPLGSV